MEAVTAEVGTEEDTTTAVTAVIEVVMVADTVTEADTVWADMGMVGTAWEGMDRITYRPTTTPWGTGIRRDIRIQHTASLVAEFANHCSTNTAHPLMRGRFVFFSPPPS
jgi:hypothetical protein